MAKEHTFDDGTVVELDDDVDPADFHDADGEAGISADEYAALVEQAEAEEDVNEDDDDVEPAGGGAG